MRLSYKKRNGFRFLKVGRVSIQFVWCKRAPHDADHAPMILLGDAIVSLVGFNALAWAAVAAQIIARHHA